MRSLKIAAVCAAMIMACTLHCTAASPVLNSSLPQADSTSVGSASGTSMRGRSADSGLMEGAESMIDEVLPGGDGGADSSLGDTNGDGVIEGSDSAAGSDSGTNGSHNTESGQSTDTGTGDGYLGDESDSGMDSGTDTAQTSSGNKTDDGMGIFGIILTVVIIGAAAALLFALLPKRKNG